MKGKAGPKPGPKTGRGKTMNAKEAQAEAAKALAEKVNSETFMMPATNDIVNLNSRCKSLKKQAQETSGQIGEMIAQAVEKKSLDRKAFSIARQLDGMSQEKLAVTYRHLLRYMDDLEIPKRAMAQSDMFETAGEGENDGADESVATNVVHLDAPAREVAEAAGV